MITCAECQGRSVGARHSRAPRLGLVGNRRSDTLAALVAYRPEPPKLSLLARPR